MDKGMVKDWCGWLNQGFLKAYNIRFIDRVDTSMGAETVHISVENGHH